MTTSNPRAANPRAALLLVNLGTPEAPTTEAVRPYLAEFLSDPRVIDMPAPLRWLLLNLVILRTRPKKSAALYRSVWTERGSPLLVAGIDLTTRVRSIFDEESQNLGAPKVEVVLAMRYGKPSLPDAVAALHARGIDQITLLPMFPQYASATTGSTVERVFTLLADEWSIPSLHVLPPFYDDEGFLNAQARLAKEALSSFKADHILFSFHGVPRAHVEKADGDRKHCLQSDTCCDAIGPENRLCYRAHCVHTARALTSKIGFPAESTSVTFQSRLGRAEWLRPYTDEVVPTLAKNGVKNLLVLSPAFVADCLETIEELGVEAKHLFLDAGGANFHLVPCVNADDDFARAVVEMARRSPFLSRAVSTTTPVENAAFTSSSSSSSPTVAGTNPATRPHGV